MQKITTGNITWGINKMGVLECERLECPNIMCDRYSFRYGYICWACFDELVASGAGTDIKLFLETAVGETYGKENVYKIYDTEFPQDG
jgi:hypothetical protein